MKLSQQAIEDFRVAYRKDFGKDIIESEAEAMGIRLIELLKIIHKPIPTYEQNRKTSIDPNGSGR